MPPVFIPLQEPTRPVRPDRIALWDLGFRPFYLLAALFAALSVPLWALQFSGLTSHAWLRGAVWHAHEMVFGYTLAVVIGFLFTAGRNWSGQPTPKGLWLAALAALWVAATLENSGAGNSTVTQRVYIYISIAKMAAPGAVTGNKFKFDCMPCKSA